MNMSKAMCLGFWYSGFVSQVRTLTCLICRSNTPSPLPKLPNEDDLSKFLQVFVIVVKWIFQSSYMYISPNQTKLKFYHGFEACS